MKRFFIVFLCGLLPLLAVSQKKGELPPLRPAVGVKGGVNLSKMMFTDWHLSDLPQQFAIRPTGGVFVDLPLTRFLGIAPELVYSERGMRTVYTHYSGYDVDYSIKSRYVDFRLPVLIGVELLPWFQPYLVFGGDVGYLLGGKVHLQQTGLPNPDLTVNLGKANMNPLYLGAFGGLGFRFFKAVNGHRAQLKIEATYNHEFLDTFSVMEHNDDAVPENVNAYNITGKRFPQGIEISVGVTLPLMPDKNDACYTFSRNKWR